MGGIAGTSGPGYAGVDRGSLVVFGSMRPSPRRLFFSPPLNSLVYISISSVPNGDLFPEYAAQSVSAYTR